MGVIGTKMFGKTLNHAYGGGDSFNAINYCLKLSFKVIGVGLIIVLPPVLISANNDNKVREAIIPLAENFDGELAAISGLDNFDMETFSIKPDELNKGDYVLSVLGTNDMTDSSSTVTNVVNLEFSISEENANQIFQASEAVQSGINYYGDENTDIRTSVSYPFFNFKPDEFVAKVQKFYDSLTSAVKNCYGMKVDKIGEVDALNNAVENGLYADFEEENKGQCLIIGLSSIYENQDDVAFFYIDTYNKEIVGEKEDGSPKYDYVVRRVKVEVEGASKFNSAEEIYAQFIEGKHSKFETVESLDGQKIRVETSPYDYFEK